MLVTDFSGSVYLPVSQKKNVLIFFVAMSLCHAFGGMQDEIDALDRRLHALAGEYGF